jgi:hypothetical protein
VTSSGKGGASALLLLIIGNSFYGCEIRSLTLRDKDVPRVFQIRLVRKMEKGTEVWKKKLHNQ